MYQIFWEMLRDLMKKQKLEIERNKKRFQLMLREREISELVRMCMKFIGII